MLRHEPRPLHATGQRPGPTTREGWRLALRARSVRLTASRHPIAWRPLQRSGHDFTPPHPPG
ncbi:MAG: hypothetical protein WBO24_12200, partial [Nitrospirales bacterium]